MGQKKERKEKAEKPLETKTVKELREEALAVGTIHGVHGMNKEELLSALRKEKGIPEPEKKKGANIRDLKLKSTELKKVREEKRSDGADRKALNILRKRLSRLKKKIRRAA